MSSKKSLIILMTIGFFLSVFATDVIGLDLIKYHDDKNGTTQYYDNDSVTQISGTLKVWTETRYNKNNKEWDKSLDDCIRHSKPNSELACTKLSFTNNFYEINCKEDTYRINEVIFYDEDGTVIDTQSEPTKLSHIVPSSIVEELKNRVCK